MNLRPVRALKELDRQLDELSAADRAAREWARFEVAKSASTYTRRTKQVVDETMSLSATMMRAGEVDEAKRLMEEAAREVRTEEAALIETVNEVKAADASRRRQISRLKVVRSVATAFLSGSMFVFSAFGVVLARHLTSDDPTVRVPAADTIQTPPQIGNAKRVVRSVEIAPGVRLELTRSELRVFSQLAARADSEGLREFLAEHLPMELVAHVQEIVLSVAADVEGDVLEVASKILAATEEQAPEGSGEVSASDPEASSAPEQENEPEAEPQPEPTPENGPSPSPDPSPSDDRQGTNGTPLGGLPIGNTEGEDDQP
jgi:hypothetical protein